MSIAQEIQLANAEKADRGRGVKHVGYAPDAG
jgi:hypothetical protein